MTYIERDVLGLQRLLTVELVAGDTAHQLVAHALQVVLQHAANTTRVNSSHTTQFLFLLNLALEISERGGLVVPC